jgi:hypothetical protein
MMKSSMLYILCAVCVPVCIASIVDNPETADGYLTEGEYVSHAIPEGNEELFIEGGGAFRISAEDYSYLEVQYTSDPDPTWNDGGITDIMLSDNSELLYLDGITQEITVGKNAKAYLKGGRIDYITIGDHPSYSHELIIYCRAGYQMNSSGISGLWANGTGFDIEFIDVGSPYPPTWQGIDIVIVPEPTTLLLFGLGGLLLRRKR